MKLQRRAGRAGSWLCCYIYPSYTFYWRSVKQVVLKWCALPNLLCTLSASAVVCWAHYRPSSDSFTCKEPLQQLSQEAANGRSRESVLFLVGKGTGRVDSETAGSPEPVGSGLFSFFFENLRLKGVVLEHVEWSFKRWSRNRLIILHLNRNYSSWTEFVFLLHYCNELVELI